MQPGHLAQLEADLRAEQSELEQLLSALEHEQAALASGLGHEVERIAALKQDHATAVATLSERRAGRLAATGSIGGMGEVLRGLPEESAPRRAWRRLLELARRAQAMNEANGRVIAAHARHLEGRLAALAASIPSATYGPRGRISR